MRNVTVYENKDVVMDGQLVKKVLKVTAPTLEEPIARIELHIDGALTFTPEKYKPEPQQMEVRRVITHNELYESLRRGHVNYDSYLKLMGYHFPHIPAGPPIPTAGTPAR
ncbi:hypothetical protein CPT_Silvanus_024 [Stenotrophomonas phage Silvanus]|nr:hypothetical protein CPT_Silvanus_024 [Stenotrophomonas phage Silvanus]